MRAASEGALHESRLFRGLDGKQLEEALRFFEASEAIYRKGDYLHPMGSPLRCFGLVLQGQVLACTDDINGNRMIMTSVLPGETFGESLSFLQVEEAPVYIYASTDTRVLWLSPNGLREPEGSVMKNEIKYRFMAMLAERTLAMNSRIRILSKLSLREKLWTLFGEYIHREGREFTLPYSRNDLAVYLGANRSALSRELGRMKAEGLIDFDGNRFRVRDGEEKK